MAGRDVSHGSRRRGRWLLVVLVLLLGAGGAATWRYDLYDEYAAPLVDEWFGDDARRRSPTPPWSRRPRGWSCRR